jgi:hypothetical protein
MIRGIHLALVDGNESSLALQHGNSIASPDKNLKEIGSESWADINSSINPLLPRV